MERPADAANVADGSPAAEQAGQPRGDSYVSPHNFAPELRRERRLPGRVVLNDLTLREGRQVEGIQMSRSVKQRIARLLEEAGVPMLQVHNTAEDVRAVAELGLRLRTEVLTSSPNQTPPFTLAAHRERIDFILAHGLGLDLCFGTSDQLLLARQARRGEHQGVEALRERELDAARESVAYAKRQGGLTGTNLQDFLRADWDFLCRFCRDLAAAGVDLISFDDFAAPAAPSVYRYVFERLQREVPGVALGVHVTNDFGLASAVVLGALEGGAEVLDVGVNGYGERAGHADLAEVAVAVEAFYGMPTGVRLDRLTELSGAVADLVGVPVPPTKALVGRNAFADVTDVHYYYEGFPWVYRAISAEMVGNRRRVALAGVSGPLVLQARARELGLDLPVERCEALLPAVRTALESQHGGLSDADLRVLLA